MKNIVLTTLLSVILVIVYGKTPIHNQSDFSQKQAPLSFIENKGQVTDQYHKPRTDIQFRLNATPGLNIFVGNGAIHYQFAKAENINAKSQSDKKQHLLHNPKELIPEPASYIMYRMDVELAVANKNAQVISESKQSYYENYFTDKTNEKGAIAYTYNRITYKNIYPNIDWVLYIKDGKLEHEFIVREGGKPSDIQLKYSGETDLKQNDNGSLIAFTPLGTITEEAPVSYQSDGKVVKTNFKFKADLMSYEIGKYSGSLVIDPSLMWATYYGGSDANYGQGVATDHSGNIYITGWTGSLTNIATSGAYQTTYGGGGSPNCGYCDGDAFLAKFSNTGSILWATYFGGDSVEHGYGVAVDTADNVFITGMTESSSGIATTGAYQTTLAGEGGLNYGGGEYGDAFLAKFTSAGSLLWGTYFGGSGGDCANGISTDLTGSVYITGTTGSTSGIATPGAYQTDFGNSVNGPDAFLAKFSSSGSLLWATYFGGYNSYAYYNTSTGGSSVITDKQGDVYIAGATQCTLGIATSGAFQTSSGGGNIENTDAFLAKFNSNGNIQWATFYGGSWNDDASGVAIDSSGNVYIEGTTQSPSGIATPGTYMDSLPPAWGNVYLAKFNSVGSRIWGTYYGGIDNYSYGDAIACDHQGNIFITGSTLCNSGIATTGAYQNTFGGSDYIYGDAFLAKFNSVGNLSWGTYYGGSNEDAGFAVAMDNTGNAFITGITQSAFGIATGGAYQITIGGSQDYSVYSSYLAKFGNCSPPIADFSVNGASPFCAGDSELLIANAGRFFFWNTGDTSQTIVATETGAYQVTITDSMGCSAQSSLKQITSFPSSDLTQYYNFQYDAVFGPPAETYQWYYNGQLIPGATQQYYNITQNGTYYAIVTDSGCTVQLQSITVTNVGIANINSTEITIQPNPTNGNITISGILPQMVNVFDEEGRTVLTFKLTNTISLADLADGMYLIQLTDNTGSTIATAKVVKKN